MDAKQANIVYHDWEATHYDHKWSISFDERCRSYAEGRFRKAVPGDETFDDVLEVGAGTGFFLLNLAQSGIVGRAHATDISEGMVRMCVANGARLGIDVEGRVADAAALPFPDASFDLVTGHAVVHHLPDLDAAFAELRRVLRPGGRLVIAGEPTRVGDRVAGVFKRLARSGVLLAARVAGAERVLAPPPHHEHPDDAAAAALEAEVDQHTFAPAELEALARRAGFADVRSTTEELTASWFGWTARTVEGMVGVERLPKRYPWVAYGVWRTLFTFDEVVARRIVPQAAFYNCILTGTAPG